MKPIPLTTPASDYTMQEFIALANEVKDAYNRHRGYSECWYVAGRLRLVPCDEAEQRRRGAITGWHDRPEVLATVHREMADYLKPRNTSRPRVSRRQMVLRQREQSARWHEAERIADEDVYCDECGAPIGEIEEHDCTDEVL